jgi:hypothetical protein
MARLTPLNYNQQIVDPLTRAMEGYQSGLAARTQRESVALQREQAAEASELRGLQMEQMRASIQAQEAATARKAKMDQDVAAVLDNPSLEGWQNLVTKYPELDETFQSRISEMEDEEKQVLGQDLVTMNSFLQSGDTSALTDFLTQKRDAALNSGDSEKVELFENALETLSVGDTGLDILGTTIQGMAAINFGDNEAMMGMFFPEDQKPTALMQNIDAYNKAVAEGDTQTASLLRANLENQANATPGFSLQVNEDGTLKSVSFGGPPVDLEPDQRPGEDAAIVRIPGQDNIVVSPGPQQKLATKQWTAFAAMKDDHDIIRKNIQDARDLIEGPLAGGIAQLSADIPLVGELTPAAALNAKIDVIKNNIAFSQLAEMRANSPTGSAVGQLTDNERRALEGLYATLDPERPEEFLESLTEIEDILARGEQRYMDALMADYGNISKMQSVREQAVQELTSPSSGESDTIPEFDESALQYYQVPR